MVHSTHSKKMFGTADFFFDASYIHKRCMIE